MMDYGEERKVFEYEYINFSILKGYRHFSL